MGLLVSLALGQECHPTSIHVPGLCCKVLLYLTSAPEESRAHEGRGFHITTCYCQKRKSFGFCSPCAQLARGSSKLRANASFQPLERQHRIRKETFKHSPAMEGIEPTPADCSAELGILVRQYSAYFIFSDVSFKVRKLHFPSEQTAAGSSLEEWGPIHTLVSCSHLPSQKKTICSGFFFPPHNHLALQLHLFPPFLNPLFSFLSSYKCNVIIPHNL